MAKVAHGPSKRRKSRLATTHALNTVSVFGSRPPSIRVVMIRSTSYRLVRGPSAPRARYHAGNVRKPRRQHARVRPARQASSDQPRRCTTAQDAIPRGRSRSPRPSGRRDDTAPGQRGDGGGGRPPRFGSARPPRRRVRSRILPLSRTGTPPQSSTSATLARSNSELTGLVSTASAPRN